MSSQPTPALVKIAPLRPALRKLRLRSEIRRSRAELSWRAHPTDAHEKSFPSAAS